VRSNDIISFLMVEGLRSNAVITFLMGIQMLIGKAYSKNAYLHLVYD
jgi:hypothetical protein